jgi:C-terminal processing protease CtpA/Prc
MLLAVATNVNAQRLEIELFRPAFEDFVIMRDGSFIQFGPNAGVMVSQTTTPRDTTGVLITAIAPGSAAEKAGLAEGNRVASVNGVNLKLSPTDVAQMDMQGFMARRFQREMSKVRPGDSVRLNVHVGTGYRNVVIHTEAAKLPTAHSFVTGSDADKASIGAVIGGNSTRRDTLGVLVMEIAEGGPLAKSGIYEGSRIAAIAGVDLRVPVASAGDARASTEKANLLVAELGKLTAGKAVELRVYDSGRYRNVTVTTARRGDLDMPGTVGGRFVLGGRLNGLFLRGLSSGDRVQNMYWIPEGAMSALDRHVFPLMRVR